MDFVYPCRDGDNEELRYSIRSVVNSFPDAKIWLAGGKPDWYVGNYISVDQISNPHNNQLANLTAVCQLNELADNFVLMNDDFFIMNKINKIDYFHGGLLQHKIDLYTRLVGDTAYVRKLMQTLNRLNKYKMSNPIDYELHVPFPVEKDKFNVVLEKDGRFNWRSIYGNRFGVGGEQIMDVKVYSSGGLVKKSFDYLNNDSDFLSSIDSSFDKLEPILKEKFPNKTQYEK